MKKYYLLCLLLQSSFFFLMGQGIELGKADDIIIAESMSEQNLTEVMNLLEGVINEYAEAATLLDPKEKQVNETAARRFNALFSATAKVMEDYAEDIPVRLISYRDYSLEAYNLLRARGIEMNIESAELLDITSDGLGYYTPRVLVRKRMFTQVTEDGQAESLFAGVMIEQVFKFDIREDDLSRAEISEIDFFVKPKVADLYNQILSFSVGLGSAGLSPSTAGFFSEQFEESSLDLSGGFNYSFGAEIMTDRFVTNGNSPNRQIAGSLGLRFASYSVKSSLNAFIISAEDEYKQEAEDNLGNTNAYHRIVNSVNVEEDLNLNVLEIPIGVSYYIQKQPQLLLNLHVRAVPSFALSSTSTATGVGFYDGILLIEDVESGLPSGQVSQLRITRMSPPSNSNASDPNLWITEDGSGFDPFMVGERDIDSSSDDIDTKFGFGLQFSPTIYWSFSDDNPTWGVLVGLDLNYQFGYWLSQNPIESIDDAAFKYADDYNTSLANLYLESLSGFNYGLRVGLFNRLFSAP